MQKMKKIDAWLSEQNIDEVEALVPDMAGVARGKLMPARKYQEEKGLRLPEEVFVQTVDGLGPDLKKYPDLLNAAEIDVELRPDASTIRRIPWAVDPSALVIHDAFYADGAPVDIAPRSVLRRVVARFGELGMRPVVAPELEFYLVKPNTDADYPLEPPLGRSGRAESGRQAFSVDAVNEFDPLWEDIYDYCEAQDVDIDTLMHESGAAQMEVNLLHGEPLELADQSFLFKRTVREAALRHKMYATFMSKPMAGEPGSAMHIHQSVVSAADGGNVFSAADGAESPLFRHFIGGLQKYLPQAMLLFAPNVNSYRRLGRYLSAPINAQWGYDNRTVGLRVPVSDAQARRVENRVAGADANPYIAIAASLACGYLGMREKLEPQPPLAGSAYDLPYQLPRGVEEAITRLRGCDALGEILGERFVRAYSAVKEREYETFFGVISSWEREFLLLNV